MERIEIRLLAPEDFEIWKILRLRALSLNPEAFGSSHQEEINQSDEEFIENIRKSTIFGAFAEGQLVGCAGFYVLNFKKMRHRGVLFGMYIEPKNRKSGCADELVKAVLTHAKSTVLQIHLSVITSNQTALNLYQRHGFRIYGTEPRSLKIDDKFYDEHLMVLAFD